MPSHAAIILAAGKSTRMNSKLPKPLQPVCGLPVTAHVIRACREAGIDRIVVVVGHEAERVRAGLGEGLEYALQLNPRGTGHAVMAAQQQLGDFDGPVLVLAGDVPLLRSNTLASLLEFHNSSGSAATLLSAIYDDPKGYGRVVRLQNGSVECIIEHKDANPEVLAIKECNSSLYCFDCRQMYRVLPMVQSNNNQGELYLTDTVGILTAEGFAVNALIVADSDETMGVNSKVELSNVARIMRQRILESHMSNGVTVIDPMNTYVDYGITIGQDTILWPGTYLQGETQIGSDCNIGPNSVLKSATVGDGCSVVSSFIDQSVLHNRVKVGPFSNIRPGCELYEEVKIGDFVELKNASLGRKVSASHLSYIGDAEVGAGSNIGAGVITCNYDGYEKRRTTIGEGVFVGSNSALIAPVSLGKGSLVGAGSVITKSVEPDAIAVARTETIVHSDAASRRRARKEAEKAARAAK